MNRQPDHYDCIVVGFGGVGSQALRFAAEKGWSVLGLDRFGPAHDQGSSHGQTRIIRRAYFEHPSYVPLANRSFEMWEELNRRHRTSIEFKQLINPVGLLQIGHRDSDVIEGVAKSAQQHNLRVEEFSAEQIEHRLPIFKIASDHVGLFEADAAFLRVEQCVAAAINQAILKGAKIQSNVAVHSWKQLDGCRSIEIETSAGKFSCERLIISAGGWTTDLLKVVNLELQILQKQQHWFQIDRVDQKYENSFPCFLIEQNDGQCFYGIPEIDYLGMKVCEHSGGRRIDHPDDLNRGLNDEELKRTQSFMQQHLRFGHSRMVHHSCCMYTMSADGHFVVDRHPEFDNVVFATGLSGHGFKFAPAIGNRLIGLLEGEKDPDFDFLTLQRS